MAKAIEYWPIERLKPYEKNARVHSDAQVQSVMQSILEFGFVNPILVSADDGVTAGHCRLDAAKRLQLPQVPVIVLDHLTADQRRAYVLADNRLAEMARWDYDLLKEEMQALHANGFDLEVAGFSDEEWNYLFRPAPEEHEEVIQNIPPTPVHPVTRPGDVWRIGDHVVVCGDARESSTWALALGEWKANLVMTSPPYADRREYDPKSGFTPIPPDAYGDWYEPVVVNLGGALAPAGSYLLNIKESPIDGCRHLYVNDLVTRHVRKWGWNYIDEFCWNKTSAGIPGGYGTRLKNAWEPVFHFTRDMEFAFFPYAVAHESEQTKVSTSDPLYEGVARPSNVLTINVDHSGFHTGAYPIALPDFFIRLFTSPNGIVLDPFLGSGTTIVAAARLGRRGVGIELSPAFTDVAVERLTGLLGVDAVLAETGDTIEQTAAKRKVKLIKSSDAKKLDRGRIFHRANGMPCEDGHLGHVGRPKKK